MWHTAPFQPWFCGSFADLSSCGRVTMVHSMQGSKTHPGEGSCMCPCTSLYSQAMSTSFAEKNKVTSRIFREPLVKHFNGHPLPDRPQPRGNGLGKRSFRAKSDFPRGDEVERLGPAFFFVVSAGANFPYLWKRG